MAQPLTEMAKDLTLALIENNQLAPEHLQQHLQQIHASLCELKAHEDRNLGIGEGTAGQSLGIAAAKSWKKSIRKHTIECLICGKTFKQLSMRHLRQHDLDPRSYRQQFGIPSDQPLSAKETTAMRRRVAQQIRPWEKKPAYLEAHPSTPVTTPKRPKSARKKATPSN
jgi:predicted transcriptional regulator